MRQMLLSDLRDGLLYAQKFCSSKQFTESCADEAIKVYNEYYGIKLHSDMPVEMVENVMNDENFIRDYTRRALSRLGINTSDEILDSYVRLCLYATKVLMNDKTFIEDAMNNKTNENYLHNVNKIMKSFENLDDNTLAKFANSLREVNKQSSELLDDID